MNVVIYARFSSHSQTEQSIEGQLAACYEYAKRNNMQIVGEYIDRALSGTNAEKREEFQQMIVDSGKKQFEAILVYQLDRFARNRYDSATYKAKLKKNGVRVVSVRENISDDASGILMEAVLEGMAEYYSAELAQKVKRGMDINASKCLYTGGLPSLGFFIDKDKKFQIDPKTAPLAQQIFEMYAAGQTVKQITDYMNGLGFKTSKGAAFNKNSLRDLLRNKKYIGTYVYKGKETPNGIPRIISDELFYQVQERMHRNKKAPARARSKAEYLLTTKLFCGYCKEMMIGVSGTSRNGGTHWYYTCKSVFHKKGCKKKNVKKNYIEELVLQKARAQLTDENINLIAREVEKIFQQEKESPVLKRLNRLLDECNKSIENLLRILEAGEISDIVIDRIGQKKKEREDLQTQISIEKLKFVSATESEIKFFLSQLKKGNVNDIKYNRALISIFVNSIYLYDDKITIVFNASNNAVAIDYQIIDEISENFGSYMKASAPPRPTIMQ